MSNNNKIKDFIIKREHLMKMKYLQVFLLLLAMIAFFVYKPIVVSSLVLVSLLVNVIMVASLAKLSCPRCKDQFGKLYFFTNNTTLSNCQHCGLEVEVTKSVFNTLLKLNEPTPINEIPELFSLTRLFKIGLAVFFIGFLISLYFPLELRVVYLIVSLVLFFLAYVAVYLPIHIVKSKVLKIERKKTKVALIVIYYSGVIFFFASIFYRLVPFIVESV